jgi:hypothetical protein
VTTLPIKYPTAAFAARPAKRGLLLLTLTLLAVFAFYYALKYPAPAQQEMSQQQMFDLIKAGRVLTIVNAPDASTGIRYLMGDYRPVGTNPSAPNGRAGFKVPVDMQLDPFLLSEIRQAGFTGTIETVNNTNILWPLFLNFLPVVLFFSLMGGIIWRLFKAISG